MIAFVLVYKLLENSQSLTNNAGKNIWDKEIKHNLTGIEGSEICFCLIVDRYLQHFISRRHCVQGTQF